MKKLLLSLSFIVFTLLGANNLFAQTCSFTFLNSDSGCIPIPILAYANDTADVPPVTNRIWTLTRCSGGTVFTTQPGLNPNFSYIPTVAGCYNLTMVSTTASGTCTSTKNNILIADTPQINIVSISPTAFCAPQTVTLTMNNSSSCGVIDLTRVQWGCGNITIDSSNPTTVNHLYSGNCFPQCYDIVVVAKSTCGCFSTKRVSNAVCVQQPPRANFTVDVSSGVCVSSLTSNFTADSSGPGFNYAWYVNNQPLQSSASRRFTHTFPAALNCYNIKLVVSNTFGCSDSLTRQNFICVFAAPQLAFRQDTSSKCVDSGQTALLCLRDISQPFLPQPRWRITGGNPPVSLGPFIGDSVCVPLVNVGNYKVTLIGSYGAGCTDSLVVPNSFELKANPSVCFYADSTGTCQTNLTTTFRNCSTAPPGSSYLWNFGAGSLPSSSTDAAPGPVSYLGLGNRNVSLAVTSANGCFKLRREANYIQVDTVRPAILVTGDLHGCGPIDVTPQSITFIPQGVNYSISRYEFWIYKDSSSTLIWYNPNGSAFTKTFYAPPACYDVKMRLTTTNGCVSTTWSNAAFCVGEAQTCRVSVVDSVMCFEEDSVTFNVTGPCRFNRLIVHYGDETDPTATTFVEGGVTSFSHTYQSFGDFDAVIIPVLDSCEGDTMKVHVVIKPPAASFLAETDCNTGDLVCFTNTTVGANRFHWDFSCAPDTFNTYSPCIILPRCDTCEVSLTAFNDTTGCEHTKTQNIQTACAGVTASFTPEYVSGCGITTIPYRYTNTTPGATNGTTRWFWGDGNPPQNGISLLHSYYPGVWYPYMVYTAPGGCIDTAYGTAIRCLFSVDFGPTNLCLPDSFHFFAAAIDTLAQGVGCDSIVAWHWDFGGGDTSIESNPVRYFPLGSRSVKLRVTNKYGCEDSITKVVTAGTPVYGSIEVDTNICPGSTVCITNNTSSGVSLVERWQFQGSNIDSFIGHSPPCLTYNTSGDFLFVYSVAGGTCNKSDTLIMHVHAPELSGYLSRNYASCPNPPVGVCGINTSQYIDSTTDVYTWDFGNREYLEVNPCDFYVQAGIYPVILTVVTNNGCRDTLLVDTVVIDGPYGTISHSPRGICACKDTVDFVVSTIKA
nr:PKD domain-containing protein [Chitinophagales bacterium]